MTTTEELEEYLYREESAAKLTKALSAQPAPPDMLLPVWVELKSELLYRCQDANDFGRRVGSKRPPTDFLPRDVNEVRVIAHTYAGSFSLHVVFDPETQRIRWRSGERHDEFSIGVQDQKPCLLSRLYAPYYTVEEAGGFLYNALTWARY
jgi:hypothetical protein